MDHPDGVRGISHTPHVCSISILPSIQPSPVIQDNGNGDSDPPAEAGNLPNPNFHNGILFQHVHSSQEGWWSETSYKPKTFEQICEIRAFQDGGLTHGQRLPTEERLDGKGGPERNLFYGPNSPSISPSPPLQDGEEIVPVQLSAQISEYPTGDVHGRYATHGKRRATAIRAYPTNLVPPRKPGIYNQQ